MKSDQEEPKKDKGKLIEVPANKLNLHPIEFEHAQNLLKLVKGKNKKESYQNLHYLSARGFAQLLELNNTDRHREEKDKATGKNVLVSEKPESHERLDNLTNNIINLITIDILSKGNLKERVKALEYWAEVMDKSFKKNDLNLTSSIFTALTSNPLINRLRSTMESKSDRTNKIIKKIQQTFFNFNVEENKAFNEDTTVFDNQLNLMIKDRHIVPMIGLYGTKFTLIKESEGGMESTEKRYAKKLAALDEQIETADSGTQENLKLEKKALEEKFKEEMNILDKRMNDLLGPLKQIQEEHIKAQASGKVDKSLHHLPTSDLLDNKFSDGAIMELEKISFQLNIPEFDEQVESGIKELSHYNNSNKNNKKYEPIYKFTNEILSDAKQLEKFSTFKYEDDVKKFRAVADGIGNRINNFVNENYRKKIPGTFDFEYDPLIDALRNFREVVSTSESFFKSDYFEKNKQHHPTLEFKIPQDRSHEVVLSETGTNRGARIYPVDKSASVSVFGSTKEELKEAAQASKTLPETEAIGKGKREPETEATGKGKREIEVKSPRYLARQTSVAGRGIFGSMRGGSFLNKNPKNSSTADKPQGSQPEDIRSPRHGKK